MLTEVRPVEPTTHKVTKNTPQNQEKVPSQKPSEIPVLKKSYSTVAKLPASVRNNPPPKHISPTFSKIKKSISTLRSSFRQTYRHQEHNPQQLDDSLRHGHRSVGRWTAFASTKNKPIAEKRENSQLDLPRDQNRYKQHSEQFSRYGRGHRGGLRQKRDQLQYREFQAQKGSQELASLEKS